MNKRYRVLLILSSLVLNVWQLYAQNDRGAVPILSANDRSEVRTALVIGNSAYAEAPLSNPVNDAADVAAALKSLGFHVQLKTDASRRQIIEAIRQFGRDLQRRGGVGLFFFAGHGIQAHGRNYLIPIGADIRKEHEIEDEGVNLGRVLGEMDDARNRLNIVILDACRNNPYERGFRSAGRGLASIDAPRGTLIAYATAPGSVAADGSGRNSPYTEALLQHIQKSGDSVERVFKNTRAAVIRKTNNAQVPWESSSLIGDFYFVPPDKIAATPAETSQPTIDRQNNSRKDNPVKTPQKTVPPNTDVLQNEVTSENPRQVFRSTQRLLSESDLKQFARQTGRTVKFSRNDVDPNVAEFKISGKNFENDFELISSGQVVYDKNSGLMWQQGGSSGMLGINFQAAQNYIAGLNGQNFGGYNDWRLPTVEEALSLLARKKNRGGYRIDALFDPRQYYIWTADLYRTSFYWTVDFGASLCIAVPDYYEIFVRAVRNATGSPPRKASNTNRAENNQRSVEQAQPKPQIDITGGWTDAAGTAFQITRSGDSYSFGAVNLYTGYVAKGTTALDGLKVTSVYQSNLPSTGRSEGRVSADGRTMTFTVYDSFSGTYQLVLFRAN